MSEIVAALATRTPGSPTIGVLTGLSGTGKTQISLKYAYDHNEEYDHILFVDASSNENLANSLVVGIESIDDQLHPKNVKGVLKLLVHPKGNLTRNWLIIMDNADDSDISLQDFIPACDHGCVLITSRNAGLSDLNPGGYIAMDVMSRGEAVQPLLSAALGPNPPVIFKEPGLPTTKPGVSLARTEIDAECAAKIVEDLGCLPLAVIQAACYIKKHKCLHEYPMLLKSSRQKILRWPASVQRDKLKYAHSTYAAFDTTLGALSPRALQFLGILSFFSFTGFPRSLIPLAASFEFNYEPDDFLDRPPEYQLSIDLLRQVFCPDGQWDQMELDGLLEELQTYSLVTLVFVFGTVTLRFHPLLHAWANDRLSHSERALYRAAAVRLMVCGSHDDESYLWTPFFACGAPPFDVRRPARQRQSSIDDAFEINEQIGKVVSIWEAIHAVVQAAHGERHVRTTRALLFLADAYGEQGDWGRMERMEREVVRIRTDQLGDNHTDTVYAKANLARTCRDAGRYDEAASLEQQVLRALKQHYGPKHRDIADALCDLASIHAGQENYLEAQVLLTEALGMMIELVGQGHIATVRIMKQQARCYRSSGNKEEAIKLERELLGLWQLIISGVSRRKPQDFDEQSRFSSSPRT